MDEACRSTARPRVYSFHQRPTCAMCGAPTDDAKVAGLRLDQHQGLRPRGRRGIAVTVCECRTCGLVFADPQPIPESMADHYGIPPESYWQENRLKEPPGYFASQIETVKRLIRQDGPVKAIDVGAGLGFAMSAMHRAGFEVYGMEPSKPFYDRAKSTLPVPEDRLKIGSIEDVEFPAGAFDFVTFGAVLEHLYEPGEAIAKALGWLRPGGLIQAEVPNARHFVAKLVNWGYRAMGTTFVTHISPMHSPFHLYEFTLQSFERHGARTGYAVAEHHVEVATIRNMPRLLHPLLRRYMQRTDTGLQLLVWLRKAG